MRYWLLKSEPESYSWDDLVREHRTEWTGVKNPAAALHLKAMAVGDEALFYHSGGPKKAVGRARVMRTAQADPTDAKWVSVEVEPIASLARPVTLKAMRDEPRLAAMQMLRQSRLSVSPVTADEWTVLLEMAG